MKKISILNSVCVSALLSVAGCSSSPSNIFKQFDLDAGRSLSTDASQRVIINTKTHPTSRPGRVNPERIVCAEPSPDVASIVANTFGVGINILQKGNAAVSGGQATALAQLAERTMTVQLLRDQMYRACEAYANGAIPGTEYSLLMSRNNDAMVTLMLGESASRLVGRQLATLTAEAASEATAAMPDLVADTTKKKNEREKAEAELATAKAKKETADKVVNDLQPDATPEAKKNAKDNADAAQADVDEKQKAVDAAGEEEEGATEKLVKATAKNETSTGSSAGGFAEGATALNEHAVGVAELLGRMQKEYLDQGAGEHMISACIVELGNADGAVVAKLQKIYGILNKGGITVQTLAERGYTPFSPELLGLTTDNIRDEFAISQSAAEKISKSIDDSSTTDAEVFTPSDGKNRSSDTINNHVFDAYYDAENRERRGHFSDKKEIAAERLRTYVALNDQAKASSLANVCMTLLPTILKTEGIAEQKKLAFNALVDIERIRSRVKPKTQKPAPEDPKNKKKKKTVYDRVADYVECDDKATNAKKESCRIRHIGSFIDDTDVTESNGAYVVRFARYGTEELARSGWTTIDGKLGEALKSKKPDIKKVTEEGKDYFALRAASFSSKAKADKFCTDNKAKLAAAPLKAKCIVKKKK